MKGKVFTAQEVQAIIAGNKTMFREVIKPQPIQLKGFSDVYFDCYSKGNPWNWYTKGNKQPLGTIAKCPYQVGQKIFVKERFFEEIHPDSLRKNGKIHYAASCDYEVIKVDGDGFQIFYKDGTPASPWKSPVHMKQEHSRLTLEITDIKVERLAEISKEDAIKEGATSRPNCHGYANRYEGWCMNWKKVDEASKWASNRKTLSESDVCMGSPQYAFINSWIATHKKPEEKFEANPFVWVVDFKIIN